MQSKISKTKTARAPAKRRFWTRPGRTSAWWDNFASQNVVPEEWKENFRMSRDTFLILCEELRPFIEKQATNMRLPVDVERQVASSLYYLSDEGCIRKTANAFGLSRQVISVIIRRVCIVITVHLGPKYIKLPSWHPLKLKLGTFHFLSPKGAGGNRGGVISNIILKKGGSSVALSRKTKEGPYIKI